MTHTSKTHTAIAALLGISIVPLFGAGFQLAERSVTGLGRAFSGEAAIADNASVISSNPAGMILLDDGALSAGLQYINPGVDVKGLSAGGPARDSDVAEDALVPYLYYSRKINEKVSIGLGLYSSFGLATEYSKSFASLAGTETTRITTVTLNPSVAFRVNDKWTIGVGLDVMYADGELTALNTATDPIPGAVGGTLFSLKGDDWAYGWNLGVLYEVSDTTRIGLHYRSSIDLKLEGDVTGDLVGGVKRNGSLEISLPDSAELSVYHAINDQWAVHADVTWTNWSKFDQLAPKTGIPPVDAALVKQENWEDAFRYAVGVTYKYNDRLTFRGGVAYDESPVPSTSERTLRIPDADRVWASIGVTIKINECYNLDLAYTHIFADDSDVQFSALGGNEDQFAGTASGDIDIFGIGISGTF